MMYALFGSQEKRSGLKKFWAGVLMLTMNLTLGGVGAALLSVNIADAHGTGATIGFTATAQSSTSVLLAWQSTSDATSPSIEQHNLDIWYCAGATCTLPAVTAPTVYSYTGNNFSSIYNGSFLHAGLTNGQTYKYKIREKHGGSAEVFATASIVVVPPSDTDDPVIIGTPSDMTVEATSGAGAVVEYTAPTATDDVDGDVVVSCDPASGSTFALGTTEVTCTATDTAGNSAETTFGVTVQDTTPPVITLNGDANVDLERGTAYTDAGATATDLVDGDVDVDVDGSVDTNVAGTYTVTYTATDNAGNEATETRTVDVSDTDAPTLSGMPGDMTVEATSEEGAVVTYDMPTATDLLGEEVDVECTPVSGSTFEIGDTIVSCSATDAYGNTASDSFIVTVEDTTAPVIIGTPEDIEVEATGEEGAVVEYTAPTATDDVDGDVAVSCDPASGSTFALGTTEVTCTATDAAGNSAETTFGVTVTEAPVPVTLVSIAITNPADKLSFTVGDALDIAGLIVTGTYSDESTTTEPITVENITGFNSATPVTGQVLTITFEGKTTTYTVDVVAAPEEDNGGGDETTPPPGVPQVPVNPPGGAVGLGFLGNNGGVPAGLVLGASTAGEDLPVSCTPYLGDYLRMGKKNNSDQVVLLQTFLNANLGLNIPVTGYFGHLTHNAVKQFQTENADQVLAPWVPFGLTKQTPTGYVYKTTKRWINLLQCKTLDIPMPQLP